MDTFFFLNVPKLHYMLKIKYNKKKYVYQDNFLFPVWKNVALTLIMKSL